MKNKSLVQTICGIIKDYDSKDCKASYLIARIAECIKFTITKDYGRLYEIAGDDVWPVNHKLLFKGIEERAEVISADRNEGFESSNFWMEVMQWLDCITLAFNLDEILQEFHGGAELVEVFAKLDLIEDLESFERYSEFLNDFNTDLRLQHDLFKLAEDIGIAFASDILAVDETEDTYSVLTRHSTLNEAFCDWFSNAIDKGEIRPMRLAFIGHFIRTVNKCLCSVGGCYSYYNASVTHFYSRDYNGVNEQVSKVKVVNFNKRTPHMFGLSRYYEALFSSKNCSMSVFGDDSVYDNCEIKQSIRKFATERVYQLNGADDMCWASSALMADAIGSAITLSCPNLHEWAVSYE